MIKSIYAAVAAPGAGKTKALITKLPELISLGERVIIALPTLNLCNDVITEMRSHGLTPRVINSKNTIGKSAANVINGVLRNKNEDLIIVTHEGLRLSDPTLLHSYILVIDEVPDVFEFQHILNLHKAEAEKVFAELDSIDGLLYIKAGRMTHIKNRVKTYKAAEKAKSVTSTLSKAEFQIFNTLTSKGMVHFEEVNTTGQSKFNFFTIEEKSIFKHIQKAKETHILAANIRGGLFDCFAKLHGYQLKKSKFTPNYFEYSCPITIYPMLSQSWSKTKVLTDDSGKRNDKHLGQSSTQLIDKIFANAISNSPNEKFIAIQNSWGNFDKIYIAGNKNIDISFPDFDCRGLNTLQDKTAAILLFSGKPSPNDKKSLRLLAKKHGMDINELEKSWIVKNKLEASLQAVTRTAIRNRNNTKHIKLYVQDMEVAEYLTNTYMKNATVDTKLAMTPPQRPDRRANNTQAQEEAMYKFIEFSYKQGIARSEINKLIAQKWPMSLSNARKKTKHLTTMPKHEPEGLTRFFV